MIKKTNVRLSQIEQTQVIAGELNLKVIGVKINYRQWYVKLSQRPIAIVPETRIIIINSTR